MTHKHAAMIHAWADGAEIERRTFEWNGGKWGPRPDCDPWMEDWEYRIKPQPVVEVQRVRVTFDNSRLLAPVSSDPNLRLTFTDGKLSGAEVLARQSMLSQVCAEVVEVFGAGTDTATVCERIRALRNLDHENAELTALREKVAQLEAALHLYQHAIESGCVDVDLQAAYKFADAAIAKESNHV